MNNSSFDQVDFLQTTRPFNFTSTTFPTAPPESKKTKFGSILNDLSSFLTTAADTAVTVDGVINGGKNNPSGSSLTPEQQMALTGAQKSGGPNMTSMLLIGGVVAVGGGLMYTLLKKKS
ncbi:hypothetical protein NC796_01920 [Aliifodinibius sp. S!AR15-10]|uniref:hypothetical protein n=1 Tax=Aliifodinibius sp. S!AR15-10 TaxID=2950437 RepID=UPI0028675FBE|nr:hypothetical protein [Aliifodinibius sp. S!AR15-10]MDR8389876.1 hypothetical protein [Aliifodinibius sp. S!AR15-10]